MEQMKNVIDRVDNTVLAVIIDRNDHNAFNNAVRYFGVEGVNFIELDDHMIEAIKSGRQVMVSDGNILHVMYRGL